MILQFTLQNRLKISLTISKIYNDYIYINYKYVFAMHNAVNRFTVLVFQRTIFAVKTGDNVKKLRKVKI